MNINILYFSLDSTQEKKNLLIILIFSSIRKCIIHNNVL